ncbi:hypothetical protein [Hymenobacter roseosalivarius]|nr:hypothetical protein [Hymenobacter roseosalivarius]
MLPPYLDFLQLSYRPDLQVLFMRWGRPVSSQEHRQGYGAALELARTVSTGRWLVDLRSRGLASLEDFAWILTDFRVELAAALPPAVPRRIAYLVAPYHADTIRARLTSLEPTYPAALRQSAVVRAFTEEQPAQQWLRTGKD